MKSRTQIGIDLVKSGLLSRDVFDYLIYKKPLNIIPQPNCISDISNIPEKSSNIKISGIILDKKPIKRFIRKDTGDKSSLMNFLLKDESGSIWFTAWGASKDEFQYYELGKRYTIPFGTKRYNDYSNRYEIHINFDNSIIVR